MSDKYEMNAHCNNCQNDVKVYIPKGTTVQNYEKVGKCSYCGVEGMLRVVARTVVPKVVPNDIFPIKPWAPNRPSRYTDDCPWAFYEKFTLTYK